MRPRIPEEDLVDWHEPCTGFWDSCGGCSDCQDAEWEAASG